MFQYKFHVVNCVNLVQIVKCIDNSNVAYVVHVQLIYWK